MSVDVGNKRWMMVALCSVSSVMMSIILVRMIQYLACKKTIQANDKYIFVRIIRKHKHKKEKINKQKLTISFGPCIRYIAIMCTIMYCCGNIFAIHSMNHIDFAATEPLQPQQVTAFSFWYIGRIFMHIVFVERLKSSFKDTKWMYSDTIFKYLYAVIITIFLLCLVEISTLSALLTFGINLTLIWITIVTFYILITLDTVCSVVLYILYQRKVFHLITSYYVLFQNAIKPEVVSLEVIALDTNNLQTNSVDSEPSLPSIASHKLAKNMRKNAHMKDESDFFNVLISDSIVLAESDEAVRDIVDARNKKILNIYNQSKLESINTITQYTVLICISFITSFLPTAMSLSAASAFHQGADMAIYLFWFQVSIAIDCFINTLCLYLHFPFSIRLYKCVCGKSCCMHKKCLSCVGAYVNNNIENE